MVNIAATAVNGSCPSCCLLNQSPFANFPLLPLPRTAVLTAAWAVQARPLERCLQPKLSFRHVLKQGCTSPESQIESWSSAQACPETLVSISVCPIRRWDLRRISRATRSCVRGSRPRNTKTPYGTSSTRTKVANAEVEKKRRAQEDERRRLMEERPRKAEEAKRAKAGPCERKEDWAEEEKARGEVTVCDSESVTVSALRICACLGELWMCWSPAFL